MTTNGQILINGCYPNATRWDVSVSPPPPSLVYPISKIQETAKLELNISGECDEILRIKVLKTDKVLLFTFADGVEIKTICSSQDLFDFEFACFLAIAKKKYKKTHTHDGIYQKAFELQYLKRYVKIVKSAIKRYCLETEAEMARIAHEEDMRRIRKVRKARKEAKKRAKKEKRILEAAEFMLKTQKLIAELEAEIAEEEEYSCNECVRLNLVCVGYGDEKCHGFLPAPEEEEETVSCVDCYRYQLECFGEGNEECKGLIEVFEDDEE